MNNTINFQEYVNKKNEIKKQIASEALAEAVIYFKNELAPKVVVNALFNATHKGAVDENLADTTIAEIYAKTGKTGFEYRA